MGLILCLSVVLLEDFVYVVPSRVGIIKEPVRPAVKADVDCHVSHHSVVVPAWLHVVERIEDTHVIQRTLFVCDNLGIDNVCRILAREVGRVEVLAKLRDDRLLLLLGQLVEIVNR